MLFIDSFIEINAKIYSKVKDNRLLRDNAIRVELLLSYVLNGLSICCRTGTHLVDRHICRHMSHILCI